MVGDQIRIGRGRFYVEGLLVENFAIVDYDSQPYLIDPADSSMDLLKAVLSGQGETAIQLFLEVWQQLVTQLDDPCLQEPALCQADTTARLQTVWRVVAKVITQSQPSQPSQPGNGSDNGLRSDTGS